MADSQRPDAAKPFVGVATTTPIAFVSAGTLYLERMSMLAADGAGILSEHVPAVGEVIPVVFTLSTSKQAIRCQARVAGEVPTTPTGLTLRREIGDGAFFAAVASTGGDSATMMFRLSDFEKRPPRPAAPPPGNRPGQAARGFCVRFVDLSDDGRAAVEKHLRISRQLGDQLARRGDRMVALVEDDRARLSEEKEGDDLSKRALDW